MREHVFDFSVVLGHLSGRLVDGGGSPLAGVVVDAMSWGSSPPYRSSGRAPTDAHGEYGMDLVPGVYRVSVRVEFEKERSFDEVEDRRVTVRAGASGPRADFQLQSSGTIEGVVLHADGRPAPGARVSVARSPEEPPILGQSDGTGRFRILSVPGGRHWLSAALLDEPERRTFTTSEPIAVALTGRTAKMVELRLVPAAELRVHLVDRDGAPVMAPLEALDANGRATSARTIDRGLLALLVSPGPLTLRSMHDGRLFERHVEAQEGEIDLEFRLE